MIPQAQTEKSWQQSVLLYVSLAQPTVYSLKSQLTWKHPGVLETPLKLSLKNMRRSLRPGNIFGVTDLHPGLLRKDPYRTLCWLPGCSPETWWCKKHRLLKESQVSLQTMDTGPSWRWWIRKLHGSLTNWRKAIAGQLLNMSQSLSEIFWLIFRTKPRCRRARGNENKSFTPLKGPPTGKNPPRKFWKETNSQPLLFCDTNRDLQMKPHAGFLTRKMETPPATKHFHDRSCKINTRSGV